VSYPRLGTHPIKCGNRKCRWAGYETDQAKVKGTGVTYNACPECGSRSYMFMTERECKKSGLEVLS
jgi:Zn finger protein HypA/HybF involved in hydrogenase expression